MTPEQEDQYFKLLDREDEIKRQIKEGEVTPLAGKELLRKAEEETRTFQNKIRGHGRYDNMTGPG